MGLTGMLLTGVGIESERTLPRMLGAMTGWFVTPTVVIATSDAIARRSGALSARAPGGRRQVSATLSPTMSRDRVGLTLDGRF